MWIEKKWIKENIYYINEKRWDEYVFNAPKNGKAWIINFGHTPFGSPDTDDLFSKTVQRSVCIARHLGDEFNVGFGDYRKEEKVLESYDWEWGQYSKLAPLQIIVKDGKVFQLPQKNFVFVYYTEAIHALDKSSVMTAPVYASRNDLNIYWEYTLKFLAKANPFKHLDKWLRKRFKIDKKEHYGFDQFFVNPLFKSQNPKQQGKNVLLVVVLPTAIVVYFVLSKMKPKTRMQVMTGFAIGLLLAIKFGVPYMNKKKEPTVFNFTDEQNAKFTKQMQRGREKKLKRAAINNNSDI
jgi:hypothetical protein